MATNLFLTKNKARPSLCLGLAVNDSNTQALLGNIDKLVTQVICWMHMADVIQQ